MSGSGCEGSQGVKNKIINDYSLTLLRSGYNVSSVRQIIISGLRGFKNKVRRAAEAGRKLHRSAESSLDARLKNKIYAKTSWFKNNKKAGAKKYTKKVKKNKMKNSLALKVKSVIFVPRTPSSKLCKLLRAEEQRLAFITGYCFSDQDVQRIADDDFSYCQLRPLLCCGATFTAHQTLSCLLVDCRSSTIQGYICVDIPTKIRASNQNSRDFYQDK